jgi:exonuclease III
MDYWKHRSAHEDGWRWLVERLEPDVALVQECVPPEWLTEFGFVNWHRAYPEGQQPWGTALLSRLPAKPTGLEDVDAWLGQLPGRTTKHEGLPRVHRLRGWAACAEVEIDGLGDTLVVSLHNPAFEIERDRLRDIDVSPLKLEKSEDLWLLDVVFYFLKCRLEHPLLVGGDFNYSRLLDDLYGEAGNREFFDRIETEGFVSLHRKFHDQDQQTFFQKRGRGHQLDYLYGNRAIGDMTSSCKVLDYDQVSGFSDHAPVVAELNSVQPTVGRSMR